MESLHPQWQVAIPGEYSKSVGLKGKPMSNDALYASADGQWYFIEFKNGSVDKSDIFRKIYDSIIMLVERLFGIEKLEGYLLEEAHTYTEQLFREKFVTGMEEQEKKAAV